MPSIGARVTWRGLTGTVIRYPLPHESRRAPGTGVLVRWDNGDEGEVDWMELKR